MTTLLERLWARLLPTIGLIGFFALFVFALIFAVYFLVALAGIGLLLFLIGYIRVKVLMKKAKREHDEHNGRTIDQEN